MNMFTIVRQIQTFVVRGRMLQFGSWMSAEVPYINEIPYTNKSHGTIWKQQKLQEVGTSVRLFRSLGHAFEEIVGILSLPTLLFCPWPKNQVAFLATCAYCCVLTLPEMESSWGPLDNGLEPVNYVQNLFTYYYCKQCFVRLGRVLVIPFFPA